MLLGALLMALSLPAFGAPRAELWQRWAAHGTGKAAAIDHADWNAFLQKYVQPGKDGINRVAYGRVSKADREKLDRYVQKMQDAAISKSARPEQRAYWINLYNAATVKVILDHYPVASITKINISPGIFTKGPWGKKLLTIENEALSLDDIEHRILRPIWPDPRVHYACNCASLGCPNLAPTAYSASNMEELLDSGARAYVNHPRGASVEDGKLTFSSIYQWYIADFGGSDQGVIEHLKKYAQPELLNKLRGVNRISGGQYDWSLNELR
ncbi:MAG: DUF547 domain-containing protein [Hydrocarboniphaga effusa]|nr:DUF547 domain-containing protein [Hydrocarboniphaga effusa]